MTTDALVPFRFSRESAIRIDRDGRFWHEGERVLNPRLERALASWVDVDPASGRYILKNSLDWCFVTVDDAPLAVRAARVDPHGVSLERSDGQWEPVPVEGLWLTPDGVVYGRVHHGRIPARFDRTAAFTVLDHAVTAPDGTVTLAVGDTTVPVHPLAPGDCLHPVGLPATGALP